MLQIPSKSIRVLSRPYLSQNTVPQTYDGQILAEALPLNLTIFHAIMSLSHPENYYIDLLFQFFLNELHDKLHKKNAPIDPTL